MTTSEACRVGIFLAVCVFAMWAWPTDADAEDRHQVYLGLGVSHFSNVDAGFPANDDHEDSFYHYGINGEYQYHRDWGYFYTSLGIGQSKINTQYQNGWDCSGCRYPSSFTIGVKWRLY